MIDTTHVLWFSSIVVQLFFCVYLIWTGLGKTYPVFTTYLAVSVAASLGGVYFMQGAYGALLPLRYTYYWLSAEPVLLLAQIAVALEVHAAMWKEHESFLRQTRPILWFALATALVAAALPLSSELARVGVSRLVAIMHFEFLVKRYISSVLAIFLLLSAALFVIVIHDAWESSLLKHEGMLTVYFGVYATASFTGEMNWSHKSILNGYLAAVLTLCFVVWITVFRSREIRGTEA